MKHVAEDTESFSGLANDLIAAFEQLAGERGLCLTCALDMLAVVTVANLALEQGYVDGGKVQTSKFTALMQGIARGALMAATGSDAAGPDRPQMH